MFCSQCGTKIKEGAKFCQSCGIMVKGAISNSGSIEIEKVDKKTHPFKPDIIDIPKVKFTEVMPPMFEWVRDFGEGLAAIQDIGDSGETCVLGFINTNGEMVIKKDFRNAKSFSEGLCAVSDGKKWGFIDKEGNLVIPYLYDEVIQDFKKGYSLCKKIGAYVLLDTFGKEITFNESDTAEYYPEYGLIKVEKNEKCGIFNVHGKELISGLYSIYFLSKKIIECCFDFDNYVYIDTHGNKIEFEYRPVHNDVINVDLFMVINDNLLRGYCDENGKLVIPCMYTDATAFSNGFAFVKKQNKWITIDKNNNILSESKTDYQSIFNEFERGIAKKNENEDAERSIEIIDKNFNEIIKLNNQPHNSIYFELFNYSVIYEKIEKKYYYGLIDRNGKKILECKYDFIDLKEDDIKCGVVRVVHNKKVVYFDLNTGKELFVPGKYDAVDGFHEGYAIVKKCNKYGYISCLPNAKELRKEKLGASTIDNQYLKNKEKAEKNLKEGDIIEFGRYNGKSIQWRVLKIVKTRRSALLISKNVLDFCSFDNSGYTTNTAGMGKIQRFLFDVSGGREEIYTSEIVWADSYIRSLLNTRFFNIAFNNEEQKKILNTNINTTGKRTNHTYGGEDTSDKVFLLSIDELKKYMYQGDDCIATYNGHSQDWWLRSPGINNETVASVNSNGYIEMNKYHFASLGIRPVINIKY